MKVSDNNSLSEQDSGSEAEEPKQNDAALESQERLRKLLSELELTPEQTRDDKVIRSSRDQEILDDVPPHHG